MILHTLIYPDEIAHNEYEIKQIAQPHFESFKKRFDFILCECSYDTVIKCAIMFRLQIPAFQILYTYYDSSQSLPTITKTFLTTFSTETIHFTYLSIELICSF